MDISTMDISSNIFCPSGRGALPGFKGKFEWKTEDLTGEKLAVRRAILV